MDVSIPPATPTPRRAQSPPITRTRTREDVRHAIRRAAGRDGRVGRDATSAPTIIVLATSGSPAGRQATAVAANLAKALGARLTIVHVVPPIERRVGRLTPTLTLTGRLHDPDANHVLREARQIALSMGVTARTVLIAGNPAREITTLATGLGADLLVIGAAQRRGLAGLLPHTGRLIYVHAPCPVIIAPADLDALPRANARRSWPSEISPARPHVR